MLIYTCGFVRRQPKEASGWPYPLKGGEAVSTYEIIIVIFTAMTFTTALVKLAVYIVDSFSKKK